MVIRLCPIGHLILGNHAAAGPKLGIVIPGIVAEFSPVPIGDFKLADVKCVEIHCMDGALA